MKTFTGVLLLAVGLAACGSAGARSTGRSNPTLITAEELRGLRAEHAYEAIERLRPQFLKRRGAYSLGDRNGGFPVVRLDAAVLGELNQLRTIPTDLILGIEFISAADATTRWGTGHTGGVILVTTKR